jgi:hypothetical protein
VSGFAETTLSRNGRIAFGDVHYAVPVDEVSQQAKDALEQIAATERIRTGAAEVREQYGVTAYVTGTTASNIDGGATAPAESGHRAPVEENAPGAMMER